MYGKIIIKTPTGSAQFRTNAYDCIYDYLISKGFDHETAENVASWAENAPYDAEWELEGAEIFITE